MKFIGDCADKTPRPQPPFAVCDGKARDIAHITGIAAHLLYPGEIAPFSKHGLFILLVLGGGQKVALKYPPEFDTLIKLGTHVSLSIAREPRECMFFEN